MENNRADANDAHEHLVRWITFHLGEEVYGIEVKQVREILLINNILPVPGAPDYVLGITNIRGNVVTVLDARTRINLPAIDHTDSTRMIVLESDGDVAAIVVDNVVDIIDLPESSIDLNPKLKVNKDSKYINGVVTHSGGLIIILNAERFITEEQLDMVSGL
jgi:purine-binding chemotaxis protein CheW